MAKRIELRGRPHTDPRIGVERGRMFKARIPRNLHLKMKRAAKAEGLHLGRWLIELGARQIGATVEAPLRRLSKKKSAA